MGVVYLGCDPDDRPVAVKVLRRGVPAEATARRRLAREVETMRRVRSPYVAEVVDADVEGSPPYIVTRYVAGRTLEDVVAAGGPLTGQRSPGWPAGWPAALAAVHAAGVVHRDLKPGNVMLVDGEPVVIDFGIAQALDSTRLTMTGMFMGTPGYLAPEVIEGKPSGPAADVHSWAATMAYAATGRPPFGTGQFEAIFYRIVNGQPDLTTMPAPLLPIVLAGAGPGPEQAPVGCRAGRAGGCARPGGAGADLPAGATSVPVRQVGAGLSSEVTAHGGGRGCPGRQAARCKRRRLPAPRPGPAPGRIGHPPKDDFGDLLPPVRYGQPAVPLGLARRAGPAGRHGSRPAAGPAGCSRGRARLSLAARRPCVHGRPVAAPPGPAARPGRRCAGWRSSPAPDAACAGDAGRDLWP